MNPRDYLRTFYGSVPQSIREIYVGYLGWNEGDPTLFKPLPAVERARRYVMLMGGPQAVLNTAGASLQAGLDANPRNKDEIQWAAELTINVIRGFPDSSFAREGRALKALCFMGLATTVETNAAALENDWWSLNPNWRHVECALAKALLTRLLWRRNWLVGGALQLELINRGFAFPSGPGGLVAPQIQIGLPPVNFVRQWCWMFIPPATAIQGLRFGFRFEADPIWYGAAPLRYILHVDKAVARLTSEPQLVDAEWGLINLGISVNRTTLLQLITATFPTQRLPNGTTVVVPDIFSQTMQTLIANGSVSVLAGTAAAVVNFFLPVNWQYQYAYIPDVVGR